MTNKIQLIQSSVRLACTWVPTGEGRLPLACVWAASKTRQTAYPASSTDEAGRTHRCA